MGGNFTMEHVSSTSYPVRLSSAVKIGRKLPIVTFSNDFNAKKIGVCLND
jgi:hypothetical protein